MSSASITCIYNTKAWLTTLANRNTFSNSRILVHHELFHHDLHVPKVSDMQPDPCGPCAPRPLRGLADLAHHAPTWPWASPRPNISQPTSYASLTSRVLRTYATLASRTSESHSESNSLSQRANIRTCLLHVRACLCVHPHMPPTCPRITQGRPSNVLKTNHLRVTWPLSWPACVFPHARPDAARSAHLGSNTQNSV